MNFGPCPYDDCDGSMLLSLPADTVPLPAYGREECPACKRPIWYRYSRLDPMAFTPEQFEQRFTIDHELKRIVPKEGVQP